MTEPSPPPGQQRTLRAGDLDVELTAPATTPRGVVVLVPGLLATSRFFRVDADAGKSLARLLLEDLNFVVVHFDPRGVGRNRDRRRAPIDFASRVADLRLVVDATCGAFPRLPLSLLGHSFGGTTIYGLLASGESRPRAVVTVGSPARFVPRPPPWDRLFSAGTCKLLRATATGDWIDLPAFSYLQNKIFTGRGNWPWLPLWAIRLGYALTTRSRLMASVNVRAPKVASIAFHASPDPTERDYSARELRAMLSAPTLERESAHLLQQLLTWGQAGGAIALPDSRSLVAAAASCATPVLVALSSADELVLPDEAAAWDGPASVAVDVGACGHGGYFFKPAPRAMLLAHVEAFLGEHG
ncbi:MAG: alpha/beta fold hydrolase [Planctomycetota bacterium]